MVDQPGEGLQHKPIPANTVKQCFTQWVQDKSISDIPLAHDGMRNIYAPEMLLPASEEEQWSKVEIPSGRKRPMCTCEPPNSS